MEITEFSFSFIYLGRKFDASCQKFKVHDYPQYRVAVDPAKEISEIFIFYEVNNDKQKFFWYPLPETKEHMARIIATALERLRTGAAEVSADLG